MNDKPAGVVIVPWATLEADCLATVLRQAGLTASGRITVDTRVRVVAAGRDMGTEEMHDLLVRSAGLPTVVIACPTTSLAAEVEGTSTVAGVLTWDSDPSVLARAVEAVASGRGLPTTVLDDTDPCEPMTSREVDVLRLVARGHRDQEIAGLLGISANTVRTHLQHAMWKLNVTHRQAAAAAVRGSARLNAEVYSQQPDSSGESS